MITVDGKDYYHFGFVRGNLHDYPIGKYIKYKLEGEEKIAKIVEHKLRNEDKPLDSIICQIDKTGVSFLDIPVLNPEEDK